MAHEAQKFKTHLYQECRSLIAEKMAQLNAAFAEAKESLESESRSTAGDKHETGRAMLQLEQEKMGRQFRETQKLESMLQRVPYDKTFNRVQSGALVKTTTGCYFIAVGIGPVKILDKEVYVLAPASPLVQVMLGKEAGDDFEFRGSPIKILSIS